MIIIDTSVWIDHLRGIDSPLDDILGTGTELLHPFVFGELLLNGLPKRGAFNEQLQRIKPAPLANMVVEADRLRATLPPASWNVIRLAPA